MKKTTKTLVKEYDDEGKLIKETETTIEEEYNNNYDYSHPYIQPYTYPYTPTITYTTTDTINYKGDASCLK